MDYGDILPSGDGTYKTWVSAELDPQSSDLYSCHVEHGGVHVVLQGSQGKDGVVAVWGVRLRKGGEREAWITVCFRTGLLNQRFSFWSQASFILLKKLLSNPKSFCLFRLHLFLFTVLQNKN